MRGPGIWLSRTRAIVVLVVFAAVVLCVGLMAGLIRPSCSSTDGSSRSTPVVPNPTTGAPGEPSTTPGEQGPWTDPFLPSTTLQPIHYDLWFYPDFYYDAGTYEGRADIEINITSPTSFLIVHYKMMNMTSTTVRRKSTGEALSVRRVFAYDRNQYWVTELENRLEEGDVVVLALRFDGSLLNGIVGYYKSTYVNALTGKESWMATTKFQPTDARKAFPNFDEPKYKTTFTITLKHWSNFTALSNMPAENSTSYGIWNETTFQKSPKMSSYLVCFIVTDFLYKENKLANGIPHRVWSRPDSINQVDYALKVGQIVSDYFAAEYAQEFHLPKLDHVAVPDYPSGATEHWGIITYRQARLLYDEKQVSADDKQRVASIVGHELAHNYFGNLVTNHWWDELWLNEGFASYYGEKGVNSAEPDWQTYFGNLVTCHWWDDLWLNEGFARYVQNKGVSQAEPKWAMMEGFASSTQQSIMKTDSTPTSRPVFLPVTVPDEINQAFDGIVYSKGASVLRMMEDIFGEDTVRKGIQRYLRDHAFSTVTTPDLWAAVQEEVGAAINVTEVMNPWIYQMGLPVVDISLPSPGQITATPRRFLSNPKADPTKPPTPYEYKWYLALSYQTPTSMGRVWLNKTAHPRSNQQEWIKFNQKQSGFYRVNYPEEMWKQLSNQLQGNLSVFQAVDRSHLLDDVFNLARASQLSYPVALDMSSYLVNETHYFPWKTVSSALSYIGHILYGHEDYDLWRKFIRDLTTGLMDKLQVNDEGDHLDKLLRVYIINLACEHDVPACVRNITTIFKEWIADPVTNPVPANLRPDVYAYGMRKGGTEVEWNIMWQRYDSATSGQESLYLLNALSQSQQLYLVQKYLEYCLDTNKVRTQDFFTAVNYAASNPSATYYVWSWARANYDSLLKRFGTQNRYFGRMIPDIVSGFKSNFHLEEVEAFFQKYPDAGAGATRRKQALESIRANIEWRETNEERVVKWLRDNIQL